MPWQSFIDIIDVHKYLFQSCGELFAPKFIIPQFFIAKRLATTGQPPKDRAASFLRRPQNIAGPRAASAGESLEAGASGDGRAAGSSPADIAPRARFCYRICVLPNVCVFAPIHTGIGANNRLEMKFWFIILKKFCAFGAILFSLSNLLAYNCLVYSILII